MSRSGKTLVAICALVAIYAGCSHAWWIMDSWIVTTLAALGWQTDVEQLRDKI